MVDVIVFGMIGCLVGFMIGFCVARALPPSIDDRLHYWRQGKEAGMLQAKHDRRMED